MNLNLKIKNSILYLFLIVTFNFCKDNNDKIDIINSTPIDNNKTSEKVTINYVYDGDTFDFYTNTGLLEKVRVLNIDTYESIKGERLTKQALKAAISEDSALTLGLNAKSFAKSFLTNQIAYLTPDTKQTNRDVYNRLLRSVVVNGMRYDSLIKAKGFNSKLYD